MGMIYAKTRHKEIVEAYNARLKALDEIGKTTTDSVFISIQSCFRWRNCTRCCTSDCSDYSSGANPAMNPFDQYMQKI